MKPPFTSQPKRDTYRLPDGPFTPAEWVLNLLAAAVGVVCVVVIVITKGS